MTLVAEERLEREVRRLEDVVDMFAYRHPEVVESIAADVAVVRDTLAGRGLPVNVLEDYLRLLADIRVREDEQRVLEMMAVVAAGGSPSTSGSGA